MVGSLLLQIRRKDRTELSQLEIRRLAVTVRRSKRYIIITDVLTVRKMFYVC